MIILPNFKTESINIYVRGFSPWDHMRSEWTFRAGESNHAVHLLVVCPFPTSLNDFKTSMAIPKNIEN